VGEVYTYNAPGFDTGIIGSDDTEWFFRAMAQIETNVTGMTTVGAFPISRIDNLVAAHDRISNIGEVPGDITPFANEGDDWLSAHSMSNVSDVLAICSLFAALDPTADLTDDLTPIFMATSNADDLPLTLETMTHALTELLAIPVQVPKDDRDALYRAIHAIETEIYIDRTVIDPQLKPDYQNLEVVSLPNLTRTATIERANGDIAYRYALIHLNPFAITGRESLYDDHNQNGKLDLYDEITQEGEITQAYQEDRSAFLALLNQGNITGEPVPGEEVEFYDGERDIVARYDNYLQPPHRIYFGGDDGEALSGMSKSDRLYGGGGNGSLTGNMGNDYLEGNAGNDRLDGGVGNDELLGGAGDDGGNDGGLFGGAGEDALYGGAGNDTLDGGTERDLLVGGFGQDHLIGGDGFDNLYGDHRYFDEATNQYVLVDDGVSDRLEGGLGDDIYYAGAGDVINDADGLGTVCMNVTTGSGDQVYVMLGLNTLCQTGNSNIYEEYNAYYDVTLRYTVNGSTLTVDNAWNPGNSITIENYSDQRLGINTGSEYNKPTWRNPAYISYWFDWYWELTYSVDDEYNVWWPTSTNLFADAIKMVPRFIPISWEMVLGDEAGIIIEGDDHDDVLTGSQEDDRMSGGRGDDILIGEAGDDWLFGFEDNDDLRGDLGDDQLQGGDGDDALDGGDGDDVLFGEAGDDTLDGGAGADQLYGGEGNDTLRSGEGDTLTGGVGDDCYLYARGDGNVLINNEDNDQLSRDVLQIQQGITPEEIVVSRSTDDLLLTLAGSGETITVYNYFLDGGNSEYVLDLIEFADSTQWDIDYIKAQVGRGTDGDDTLNGYTDADTLAGLAGNDTLHGGAGDDFLYGCDDRDHQMGSEQSERYDSKYINRPYKTLMENSILLTHAA
jgi:Ca2+-binding RTX toxin-like protein